jgi:hypothetical protein
MAGWVTKDFGGEIPRQNSRLLPPQMAEEAVNVDLGSGMLTGLPQPQFVVDLTSVASYPDVRKAYRIPGPTPDQPDVWAPLPSEFSSVCRSPLANDTMHRFYWTNPPGSPLAGAWWSTYEWIAAGNTPPPYNIGFIAPDPRIELWVTTSGGTTDGSLPYVARSYCFTYIDIYGSESSPTLPSAVIDGPPDATWTLNGLQTTPPGSPSGKNYPAIASMRIYRTITGASTGAQFYMIQDIPFGSSTFVDTIPDTTIVNNNLLQSASWASPPDGLDGLVSMTGGMLIGFTANTVHFCEPDRPHAWPAGYDQSLMYPIVGFAIWQQALIVLTKGFPSSGTGNSPSQFTFAQIQVPEPCISRGSIITDLFGVYYASQNGLVMLNYFGMQNQTLSNMTKNIWLTEYQAEHIIACRHRAQYLAINGTGMGFLIDYTEQRMGIMHVSPMVDTVSVWNDIYTGNAYMIANNVVYLWDSPDTPPLNYRWRSKQFYLPAPVSLGACQISLEPSVSFPAPPPSAPPPEHGDPSVELPPGVNALFRLFVGPDGENLILTQYLTQPRCIFRLPSGRKAFNWQFEIVANCAVHSVELASTMRELKGI